MTKIKEGKWPDPTIVASNVYRLLLDNERVRVFDVKFKPGEKAKMHSHPDHVVFVLGDGKVNLALPDGSSQDVPLKEGQAMWIGAGPHETTNLGNKDVHLVVFELKEGQK
jgi:quercetin dioxygenase-like cupin family protein